MDYFLNSENVINRILEEWNKHDKLIIAYDFDNTVYDYHEKGYKFNQVIELLNKCKEIGAYFIVFTCCDDSKYDFIKSYLKQNNIPFDKINENIEDTNFKGRKIYYNILLDDRAGLESAYKCLSRVIEIKNSL